MNDINRIVEALLFSADGRLTIAQISEAVPEATCEEIEQALETLRVFYNDTGRGFALVPLAGGHQLLTRPEVAPWVERLLVGRRRQRLSRAALEVLAIVAYQQPVTRGDIEAVRGVDCGGTLRTLLERRLIAIKGRAPTVGHPLLYMTSDRFLEHFGLASLKELPKLEEFAALFDQEEAREELRQAGVLPVAEAAGAEESSDGGTGDWGDGGAEESGDGGTDDWGDGDAEEPHDGVAEEPRDGDADEPRDGVAEESRDGVAEGSVGIPEPAPLSSVATEPPDS